MRFYLESVVLVLFIISCSQQKELPSQRTPEDIHRYSVVYEGNRVIQYKKEEPMVGVKLNRGISKSYLLNNNLSYEPIEGIQNPSKVRSSKLETIADVELTRSEAKKRENTNKERKERTKGRSNIKMGLILLAISAVMIVGGSLIGASLGLFGSPGPGLGLVVFGVLIGIVGLIVFFIGLSREHKRKRQIQD